MKPATNQKLRDKFTILQILTLLECFKNKVEYSKEEVGEKIYIRMPEKFKGIKE